MAGKTLETKVVIGGKLEASINKAMDAVSDRMDTLQAAAEKAATAYDKLSDKIKDQSSALDAAKKRYAAYVLAGEKGTEQAEELAEEIKAMSASLSKNKFAMKQAEKAADKLTDGVDDLSKAAEDAEGGFTIMKGAIAGVIANGITALISKCADAAKSIYGLSESTREYREDMNKLDTAFQAANHTAAMAEATYSALYGVIGETDQAVEAAQQIALLANTEQDAAKWADLAAGVVGRFGDALQPETFFESANETIKLGEATGAFTQMLEGAGYSVDEFNEYLAKCNTESQKQAYMLGITDKILGDASKTYRDANGSIIDARLANSDYTDSLAVLGEKLEPVTTAVTRGLDKLLQKAIELSEGIDMEEVVDGVGKAFDAFGNAIEWVSENGDILLAILGGLTAGFVTYKAATLASTVATKVLAGAEKVKAKALLTGTTMTTAQAAATWALNGAMAFLASPITLVVAAIAALVAGGILLYKNWDKIKAKAMELGAKLSEIWSKISGAVDNMIAKIGEKFPMLGGYLSGWWESIKAVVENIKGIFRGVIDFISNIFSGNWKAAWGNIIDIFKNLFGMIGNLVKAPLNGVIGMVNGVIDKVNSISIDIPEWLGGGTFGVNIPKIPMLATGGFTDGISIAGEKAVEAVISFDPAYRSENLEYWAEAGRRLGADNSDYDLGGSSNSTSYNLGGVTFAPNITVTGNADKQSIMEAIEAEYPEFIDLLEEWFAERGVPAYG